MQNRAILQANNYTTQRRNSDDSVLLSYTQTSTRENTEEENRPQILNIDEFKRKQRTEERESKNYD